MAETWTEEVARLQREIAERQSRLQFLVLGDPRVSVTMPTVSALPAVVDSDLKHPETA